MLVGIHKSPYGNVELILSKFRDILDFNEIKYINLDSSSRDFWEIIPTLDLFIYYWEHYDRYRYHAQTILPIIEFEYGIKCLPNQATCWHYDDKIRQFYLLKKNNFPVVDSWAFWDEKIALKWIHEDACFPLVFKLSVGAGSSNVILVKNKHSARKLVKQMFGKGINTGRVPSNNAVRYKSLYSYLRSYSEPIKKRLLGRDFELNWNVQKNYSYFQEFLPNNEFDTRVTTIGNRSFAFRRYVRKNDFRASGSNDWSLKRSYIDMRMVKIAQEISQKMGFQ
ncbi:hypothetical protein ACFLSP_05045, partial [Bacteroidota bacterium]